jgi:hypothetical protein
MRAPKKSNDYVKIIQWVFRKLHRKGDTEVVFLRDHILNAASSHRIKLGNPGDVIYTFRYRAELPLTISSQAPKGMRWIIRPRGSGHYAFVAVKPSLLQPSTSLATIKIPDATPGVIEKYAMSDEQALLARIRYNRLLDVFTGLACYSLQNHLRTQVQGMGQIETDEIYVGLDKKGVHYILPVQAKRKKDRLGDIQVEQDIRMCAQKYPELLSRPIGAQFLENDVIAMFEYEDTDEGIRIREEKHYKLVPQEEVHSEDLTAYRSS